MLSIMKRLREQVWKKCRINYSRIAIDIDTTVETIYGNQQGGRKGHNTKHRGKKGYRPVLCFIEQTREYIYGKLRKGETMSGEETAKVICALKGHLPSCIQEVLLRKVFCTSLNGKAHEVMENYDKRADVENLVGEAKREGLDAIPSGKFKNNYAFFQIVMLAYNLWRYFKILAQICDSKTKHFTGMKDHTIRIARLKLLMIAAKLVKSGNRDKVKYPIHDTRTPGLLKFYKFLDRLRFEKYQECKV